MRKVAFYSMIRITYQPFDYSKINKQPWGLCSSICQGSYCYGVKVQVIMTTRAGVTRKNTDRVVKLLQVITVLHIWGLKGCRCPYLYIHIKNFGRAGSRQQRWKWIQNTIWIEKSDYWIFFLRIRISEFNFIHIWILGFFPLQNVSVFLEVLNWNCGTSEFGIK